MIHLTSPTEAEECAFGDHCPAMIHFESAKEAFDSVKVWEELALSDEPEPTLTQRALLAVKERYAFDFDALASESGKSREELALVLAFQGLINYKLQTVEYANNGYRTFVSSSIIVGSWNRFDDGFELAHRGELALREWTDRRDKRASADWKLHFVSVGIEGLAEVKRAIEKVKSLPKQPDNVHTRKLAERIDMLMTEASGSLTTAELGGIFGLANGSVSGVTNKLIQLGLMERVRRRDGVNLYTPEYAAIHVLGGGAKVLKLDD